MRTSDDALGVQQSMHELDVVTGGPHRCRDRHPADPNFQRFLAGNDVRAGGERPVLETADRGSDGYAAHRPSMPAGSRSAIESRLSGAVPALMAHPTGDSTVLPGRVPAER